jgi:uncharacterized protein (TIGR00255 family)
MIKSMTAFSSVEKHQDNMNIQVEIRSYNSRHLDLNLRMTHGYMAVEEKLRSLIAAHVVRGRVEIKVGIRDESEIGYAFEVDAPRAGAYHKALSELKGYLGTTGEIPLDLVVSKGEVIRPVEQARDVDRAWKVVEPCAKEALAGLDAMRLREGQHIADDFAMRLKRIEEFLAEIRDNSEGLLQVYKNRLKERILVLTKDVVKVDEGRIEQEAALLADKSDISEELVRAVSHIKQFNTIMAGPDPSGQSLNFLLQEMNREFNTIGSKTGKADVAHAVVAVKLELEKLREQVQNVE